MFKLIFVTVVDVDHRFDLIFPMLHACCLHGDGRMLCAVNVSVNHLNVGETDLIG
jgi:hypothetical protein